MSKVPALLFQVNATKKHIYNSSLSTAGVSKLFNTTDRLRLENVLAYRLDAGGGGWIYPNIYQIYILKLLEV